MMPTKIVSDLLIVEVIAPELLHHLPFADTEPIMKYGGEMPQGEAPALETRPEVEGCWIM